MHLRALAVVSFRVAALSGAIAGALTAHPASQGTANSYALYSAAGRRALPFRTASGVDMVSLNQLAAAFGLKLVEDALVGGLTVEGRGQPILLIPGQSFVSIGPGRVVSLPAAVERDRNAWSVPVDFIRQALGPALNLAVEIRRPTHVIVVGDVRVPRVTGRFERQGPDGRVSVDIQPATPHQVTREGNRVVVRFDALALDPSPLTGLVPEFVTGARIDGTSLVLELGPAAVGLRVDNANPTHLVIDLLPAPPPPPVVVAPRPIPQEPPAAPPAALPLPPGAIQTVVLDPGHGGEDAGARSAGGTVEKDYVLALAQRLKAGIEGRIGLRVLLTRERDENVPVDRRTSFANNNKADLFISLHANASVRPEVRGAQVLSLRLEDYRNRSEAIRTTAPPVPILGGGTRTVDAVPWDLAQLPFADKSATFATMLARQLQERSLPLFQPPVMAMPLRTLVGANMPAIQLEVGFLSNAEDEDLLTNRERSAAIVEAVVATINEVVVRRGIPAAAAGPGGAR